MLAALALLLAGPAAAAPFTATLTAYVFNTQQPMPASLTAAGSAVSGPGLATLPGGLFVGTAVATTPPTVAPPITGNEFVLTGNDPGTFSGAPLKGAMGLRGRLSLTGFGGLELIRVPLSAVGIPGAIATFAKAGVSVTAIGAAWTTGTVTVTLPTPSGSLVTSFAGYDNRVNGAGTVQLVTPIRFDSTISGSSVIWSSLRITYVPEPGTLVLLGSGALALAALGRRSRRRI
jgi:hypothetical protein